MKGFNEAALLSLLALMAAVGTARAGTRNYCQCDDIRIYSIYRYMNGPSTGSKFELECNNHGGHGYCSGNVDSAHGAGCGAMTGSVSGYLYPYYDPSTTYLSSFGRSCPDDHYTCFRGPSSCDSGGSWGNTCNCDTWHSQTSNPSGDWWWDGLGDDVDTYQVGSGWKLSGAQCSNSSLTIVHQVNEHDPICCDDPMGTAYSWVTIGEGYGSAYTSSSVQHCEDGTCGNWGSSYRVDWSNCRSGTEYCGDYGAYCTSNSECCSGYCETYNNTCY